VLVERADIDPVTLFPGGVDDDMKALDHFARAILEHSPAVDRAVEVARQIEHRLFGPVALDRHAGAAAETEDAASETGQPQGFHQDTSRVYRASARRARRRRT
jgi:hypothetical protein